MPDSAKRLSSRRRKFALVLIATVGALLAVEAAVRVRQYLRYGTLDRLAEVATHASGIKMAAPNLDQNGLRTDSQGFRSPELEMPKPAGRLRIGFLGGSTTYCAEASANETTWPHLVVERLRAAHPTANLDYFNAAVVGYASEHSRKNLEHRAAQCEPDILVIYHGTNDVANYTRELALARGAWSEGDGEESWLERVSLAWRLISRNLSISQRSAATANARALQFEVGEIVPPFRESLTQLVRDSRQVARAVVLVTFAPRVRREHDAAQRLAASNTSLYYMPYMTPDSLLESFEAYNRVVREVAAAEGAVLVEAATRVPSDDEHYNDSVHLRDSGCRVLADLIGTAMLATPTVTRLLEGATPK